eukprot:Phypoly_transcript_02801.p1 GENE.Phypoly_transcript_02801~~Phypoly_transcript_02801.p1  ORF type:complete len:778 (+),score=143.60 Phypoly_transcript_02801:127-2460(+)
MNNQHMQPMNMQNVQLLQRGDKLPNSGDGLSSAMHSMNLRGGTPKILTNPDKGEQDSTQNGKKYMNQITDDKEKKNVMRMDGQQMMGGRMQAHWMDHVYAQPHNMGFNNSMPYMDRTTTSPNKIYPNQGPYIIPFYPSTPPPHHTQVTHSPHQMADHNSDEFTNGNAPRNYAYYGNPRTSSPPRISQPSQQEFQEYFYGSQEMPNMNVRTKSMNEDRFDRYGPQTNAPPQPYFYNPQQQQIQMQQQQMQQQQMIQQQHHPHTTPQHPMLQQPPPNPPMPAHAHAPMHQGHSQPATSQGPSQNSSQTQAQLQLIQQQQQQAQYNPYTNNSQQPPRKAGRRTLQSFFMPETLRQDLLRQKVLSLASLDPEDPRSKGIPQMVGAYHSLYPLEEESGTREKSKFFGATTSLYKATSTVDGQVYVLRRVEGHRVNNDAALAAAEPWKAFTHPGVVSLKDVFHSKEFGDVNSLYFVYDYFPGADTIEHKLNASAGAGLAGAGGFVSEAMLWSYMAQLTSALRAIHSVGLAARVIQPSKVLLTGKNRIRINCIGMMDVINFDPNKNIGQYQYDDLLQLGSLIVCIALRNTAAGTTQNIGKSLEYIGSHYSADLKNLLVGLLVKPPTHSNSIHTLDDLCVAVTGKLFAEMDYLHSYTDMLQTELAKEIENGRLFKLLAKLGYINERPEHDMDPRWSETGDRYLLKLLRDYIFHQVYEDGSPVIDLAHVVECLNKLDVGSPEKILLMSRDEQAMLVVSYKDLKRCVELSFAELQKVKKPAFQQPPP